ncbi:MAG: glycosyltransferase [Solirubrobacteraceae bacterium]
MIFVTLGTHEQPFTRALDIVADLSAEESIVVQHGATPPRTDMPSAEWVDYLEWPDLRDTMRAAEVVISHAGVGSAVTAIRAGRKPVLLPRLARYHEHVDDHQLQLAQAFRQRGLALSWDAASDVRSLVEAARSSVPPEMAATSGLAEAVVRAAADVVPRRRRSARIVGPLVRARSRRRGGAGSVAARKS